MSDLERAAAMIGTTPKLIRALIDTIAHAIEGADPEKVEKMSAAMVFSLEDHFSLQTLQAAGHANGEIPTDVAHWIYQAAGNTPSVANGRPLPVRVALTQLHARMMGVR